MALAVIHHLCISNNLPLENLAAFFDGISHKNLIIEFVPKVDEKVQILLKNREDIFHNYTMDIFITAFSKYFDIVRQVQVLPTERVLFLLKKK